MMREENQDRRITIAFLASLFLHLLIAFLLIPSAFLEKKRSEELEVVLQAVDIADIERPEREERPKKARFLGLYDSSVEKEEVAVKPYLPPSQRRILTGSDGRDLKEEGEGARYAALPSEKRPLQPEEGEDLVSVLPEEFFPDVRLGEKTYLNVYRYPKISYFVRLKKIFRLTWNPEPIIMRHLFEGSLMASTIQATVAFEIDRQGNLRRLFLYQSSGSPSYDEECLRVIQASAPFAVPPKHLLNEKGVLALNVPFTVFF
ncbi:MAG: TonB family protein [Deltaproteobacteria bacterium]|nr:TonB family protein [Deltaproteobacteria bacterium]